MLLQILFSGKTIVGALGAIIVYVLGKEGIVIPEGQGIAIALMFIGLIHKAIKNYNWAEPNKELLKKWHLL